MTPVQFKEANYKFMPPSDLEESQCMTIPAWLGKVARGPVEGADIVVVAWKPDPEELQRLNQGEPIFLSCLGGLPPHFLSTSFETASKPS